MTKCFCDKCGKELSIEIAELHFSFYYEVPVEEKINTFLGRWRKKQTRTSITERKLPRFHSEKCILCKDCGLKLYTFLKELGEDNNEN